MSGRGPRGDRGPGGHGNPYRGGPTPGSSSRGGSGNNLPVWALVLIMVGSGLLTLTFVWLCVLFVCRKRRARRAAVRDLEAAQAAASQRETSLMLPGGPGGDFKDDAKRCEASEPGVELTFVVMAGEDQPSYLAKPASKAADSPTAKDDADATAPPTAPFEASEKSVEKVTAVEKSTSTPPSPSR